MENYREITYADIAVTRDWTDLLVTNEDFQEGRIELVWEDGETKIRIAEDSNTWIEFDVSQVPPALIMIPMEEHNAAQE